MPDAARRKEKQRLKRAQKKAQMRRAWTGSPYRRIGQIGQIEACHINTDWQERGMASIYLLRENPAGGHAMAAFLVDLWCAGLKDAWGRLDFTLDEFDDYLKKARDDFKLVRGDPDQARRLVAGGIRFARQNGFRLPPHYDRWTAILGELGDVNNADLTCFGKDGKLIWVGPLDDLRRRLIGCTPEQFLQRPDVEYIAGIDGLGIDEQAQAEDEAFDAVVDNYVEAIDAIAARISQVLVDQCSKHGEQAAPRLKDAVRIMLAYGMLGEADKREDDEITAEAMRCAADEVLTELIGTPRNPHIPEPLKQALQQTDRLVEALGPQIGDAGDLKAAAQKIFPGDT